MFHKKNGKSVNGIMLISVMPFGKYKGMALSEIVTITEEKDEMTIPRGKQYLKWICEQTFPSQDLKDAIQPYLTQE